MPNRDSNLSKRKVPQPQEDLGRKADQNLRFLGYFCRDLQDPKDATHMAFWTMSHIGQGFANALERLAIRIVK